MATENNFREPVFVRNDDQSHVSASVVVWGGRMDGNVSVLVKNGSGESVLIRHDDWATLVSCVNAELNRVL